MQTLSISLSHTHSTKPHYTQPEEKLFQTQKKFHPFNEFECVQECDIRIRFNFNLNVCVCNIYNDIVIKLTIELITEAGEWVFFSKFFIYLTGI